MVHAIQLVHDCVKTGCIKEIALSRACQFAKLFQQVLLSFPGVAWPTSPSFCSRLRNG
jgi:hypothetical protein